MVVIREGHMKGGRLIVPEGIGLPDGAVVRVAIEVIEESAETARAKGENSTALPGFGMWADREDMQDSVAWVNRQRDSWRDRLQRSG